MINYNNFIFEKTEWSTERAISEEMFNKFLETRCSDFSVDDNPIYRSISLDQPYYIMKSTGTRKSAYISDNYYTMLINNEWTKLGFPKRTFICTNEYFNYSMQRNPQVYRVIPFNGARIGVCPNDDIQSPIVDEELKQKYNIYDITNFNSELKWFVTSETFAKSGYLNEIVGIDKKTDEYLEEKLLIVPDKFVIPDYKLFKEAMKHNYDIFVKIYNSFIENIYNNNKSAYVDIKKDYDKILYFYKYDNFMKFFNPDLLGFKSYSYKEYANTDLGINYRSLHNVSDTMHEVWLDSDILLIRSGLAEYVL